MKVTPVAEFMTRDPIAARAEMTIPELVELFHQHRFRALPVVEADGRLVGMVTETDLFIKEKGIPFSLEKVPTLVGQLIDKGAVDRIDLCRQVTVGEVMTKKIITIDPQTTLYETAMIMHRDRVSLLPVVEDGKLVGTVRRILVLRRIYAED